MTNILDQPVLVVNRMWQAVSETDAQTALTDCAKGERTPIDMATMRAVTWDEWITLPAGPEDRVVHTVNRTIRVPTVIATVNYAKMPKKRPKLNRKGIGERDGKCCAYTGRYVENGTLDHVTPRSRGGRDTWENLVWSDPEVNQQKANRTPEEAGLRLRVRPKKPPELPAYKFIKARHPDWAAFL